MNRREFVEVVAAGAALGLTSMSSQAASADSSALHVVFDPRYSDARLFSETLQKRGAAVFAAGPIDVVGLWRTQLKALRPRAIAGLTTHSDLEVVRGCAAEIGLKLKCEIFHDSRGRAVVQHRIVQGGSANLVRELGMAGAVWPAAIAKALSASSTAASHSLAMPELQTPKASDHPGTLVSWLLA